MNSAPNESLRAILSSEKRAAMQRASKFQEPRRQTVGLLKAQAVKEGIMKNKKEEIKTIRFKVILNVFNS